MHTPADLDLAKFEYAVVGESTWPKALNGPRPAHLKRPAKAPCRDPPAWDGLAPGQRQAAFVRGRHSLHAAGACCCTHVTMLCRVCEGHQGSPYVCRATQFQGPVRSAAVATSPIQHTPNTIPRWKTATTSSSKSAPRMSENN